MTVSLIGGGVPGENNRPVACHWQTSSHRIEYTSPERGFNSQR